MTYEELAPVVSSTGITKSAVETYFENVEEPQAPAELPEVTKPKIVAIADALFSGEDFALVQLASDVQLTVGQVKTIIKEINGLHNAYLNPVEEITE